MPLERSGINVHNNYTICNIIIFEWLIEYSDINFVSKFYIGVVCNGKIYVTYSGRRNIYVVEDGLEDRFADSIVAYRSISLVDADLSNGDGR